MKLWRPISWHTHMPTLEKISDFLFSPLCLFRKHDIKWSLSEQFFKQIWVCLFIDGVLVHEESSELPCELRFDESGFSIISHLTTNFLCNYSSFHQKKHFSTHSRQRQRERERKCRGTEDAGGCVIGGWSFISLLITRYSFGASSFSTNIM